MTKKEQLCMTVGVLTG